MSRHVRGYDGPAVAGRRWKRYRARKKARTWVFRGWHVFRCPSDDHQLDWLNAFDGILFVDATITGVHRTGIPYRDIE